jgi:hypothetical protein
MKLFYLLLKNCRRNICPQSVPTQSQAIIGDDTMPTTVVRHSKHMSRPMAAPAALINQNGNYSLLNPHLTFKVKKIVEPPLFLLF